MTKKHRELIVHELFGQQDKYNRFLRIKYAKDDNFYEIDDIDILPVYGGDRLASNFTRLGLNLLLMNIDDFKDQMLISYLTNGKYYSFRICLQRLLRNTSKLYRVRPHTFKKKVIIKFITQISNG